MTTTPRPPRLRSDARRNRARIITAAIQVFAERGLTVPLDEIAARAGVGIGTLYRRFPSRDDLIEAVFDEMVERYRQLVTETGSDEDAWRGLCSLLERGNEMQVVNRGLQELLDEDVAAAAARSLRDHVRTNVNDLMERAKAQGMLRPDFTYSDFQAIFWACGRVAEATTHVDAQFWRRHLALVVDGLRAEGATAMPAAPLMESQFDFYAAGRSRRSA